MENTEVINKNKEEQMEIEVYLDEKENLFVLLDIDGNIVTESKGTATHFQIIDNQTDLTPIGKPVPLEKGESSILDTVDESVGETTAIPVKETDNSELTALKIKLESLTKGTSDYRRCLLEVQEMYLNLINNKVAELSAVYDSKDLEQESFSDDVMLTQNWLLEHKEYADEYENEVKTTLDVLRTSIIGKQIYKPKIELVAESILRDTEKYE